MKFKLTDLGKLMEAQLTAGSKPIITKIEASDAYSSNDGALLSVQNKKQDLEIEEIVVVDLKSERAKTKSMKIDVTSNIQSSPSETNCF